MLDAHVAQQLPMLPTADGVAKSVYVSAVG